jgi:RsiW-degrading membrane proteinase PrsW (M82 family)
MPLDDESVATYLLESETGPREPAPMSPPLPVTGAEEPEEAPRPRAPRPHGAPPEKSRKKVIETLPPLTANEIPLWLRHLHWFLALALLPLTFSLLDQSDAQESFDTRLEKTLTELPEDAQERVFRVVASLAEEKGSIEDLFNALPDHKLAGALLPRRSWMHCVYAGGVAVLFMAFLMLLAAQRTANPLHLLSIGLFTATIGIVFLLLVQTLADLSQGLWLRGANLVVVLFYVLKAIGFSYRAALDPEVGFFFSFLGYTLGVGLCEEVCKALPLFWRYRRPTDQSWRGAFLWGLASGAGFGIAEGIMYSGSYYNGISGPGIYGVRFISCVALHALWTGSVGITLHQKQGLIQDDLAWYEYIPRVVLIVGVPMVLHGLYDTLLKKDMNAGALIVAVLSFVFLAFQISRLHGEDDQEAKDAMLEEYKRRRAAVS